MTPSEVARAPRRWKVPSSFILVAALSSLSYFLLFFLAPFIGAMVIGLFNWDFLSTPVFVGLGNFALMFQDKLFLNGLKVSFLFVGIEVPLVLSLQLITAAILSNMRIAPQKIYLTLIFVPFVTPWLVAIMIFIFVFDSSAGLPKGLAEILGVHVSNPLVSADTALLAVVVMMLWKYLGYGALLFLVGINEIPGQLYEAATIDGAGSIMQFRRITWPLIRPILLAMSIVSFIGALQVFDPFFVMTRGGPGDSTRVFPLYLYQAAFGHFRFGYASAMAFFMFILLLTISVFQLAVVRTRWEY